MVSPIRVLHVVVNMNRGGAETLIMNLYRNIDRTKIQFDFLTCKNGVFDDEIRSLGGKVYRIPYITDVGPIKYVKELESFFKIHSEYKIVHSHLDKMSGLVLRSARKAGIVVRIAHSHSTRSEGNILNRGIKYVAGLQVLKNATDYLSCSKDSSKWLFKNHSVRAVVVKNGVDSQIFKPSVESRLKIRKMFNIPPNYFIVGHVGRFCTPKNHDFLLDIFSKIHTINKHSILILVGDGPLKNKMIKKVENMGLSESVLFLGAQNNIHELLPAFDCMVFPSLYEGLPLTLIEAQSVGLPCFISNRITNEVDIGAGLIRYESLEMPSIVWAIKSLLHDETRIDTSAFIKSQGYDIKQTAAWLQKFYIAKSVVDIKKQEKVIAG